MPAVLTCTDPLRRRGPDPQFAAEADLVRTLGGDTALIDHDALLSGDAEAAVSQVPEGLGPAWYRGWMIPSARYAEFAASLRARGTTLLTGPAAYARAHELPGWYETFAEVTPRSAWVAGPPHSVPDEAVLRSLAVAGGPVVVKDYVKSRKHEWEEACFVPDASDLGRFAAVVRRFVELQDDFLAGGVVVRSFEPFTGAEARVWWVGARPVLVGAHPDTPGDHPLPDADRIAPLVRTLGCPFVTTDMACLPDGTWRVVEVGDGQVSGLPANADPRPLMEALLHFGD